MRTVQNKSLKSKSSHAHAMGWHDDEMPANALKLKATILISRAIEIYHTKNLNIQIATINKGWKIKTWMPIETRINWPAIKTKQMNKLC